jgi:predicted Holliday junction resolvase-like endonuclease
MDYAVMIAILIILICLIIVINYLMVVYFIEVDRSEIEKEMEDLEEKGWKQEDIIEHIETKYNKF